MNELDVVVLGAGAVRSFACLALNVPIYVSDERAVQAADLMMETALRYARIPAP